MPSKKYLNEVGLAYFWEKIKSLADDAYLDSKSYTDNKINNLNVVIDIAGNTAENAGEDEYTSDDAYFLCRRYLQDGRDWNTPYTNSEISDLLNFNADTEVHIRFEHPETNAVITMRLYSALSTSDPYYFIAPTEEGCYYASNSFSGTGIDPDANAYIDIYYRTYDSASDWEQDDSTASNYVQNRPAIRTGVGENSIIEGGIENDSDAATYTIYVTGAANATEYTFTTEDTLPALVSIYSVAYNEENNSYSKITSYSKTNGTIGFYPTLSETALNNHLITIYYKFKNFAIGKNSHAEGYHSRAIAPYSHAEGGSWGFGNYSHAEGFGTVAGGVYSHAEGANTKAYGLYSHVEGQGSESSGNYSHAEGFSTIASGMFSHAEGRNGVASGATSHAGGYCTTAYGDTSYAEGYGTVAYGARSHAEGGFYGKENVNLQGDAGALTYTVVNSPTIDNLSLMTEDVLGVYYSNNYRPVTNFTHSNNQITTITLKSTLSSSSAFNGNVTLEFSSLAKGVQSHAEGSGTIASGTSSHAEGGKTLASGTNSHAEGADSIASQSWAHAEGAGTTASHQAAHAEGFETAASGAASHAQNYHTIAAKQAQTALGSYNIEDTSSTTSHPSGDTDYGQYAVLVGNGTSSARSNAHTLDWSGNGWYAGKLTVGSAPTADMDVATKVYVDNLAATAEDDEEILNLLTEYGYYAPVADADGNVVTDVDNNIILG